MSYTVSNTHPRIWLTPARVTTLKAASGNTTYTTLKAYVDAHPLPADVANSIWYAVNYALVYQVNGSTTYADAAIAAVSGALTNGNKIWVDAGLNTGDYLPVASLVYDWCNDRIVTLGLQTFFVSGMTQWADYIWPETYGTANPPGPPEDNTGNAFYAQTNPLSNYYSRFISTWMVGLSLYFDTTKASGYVNNAISRWTHTIQPRLNATDFTDSASGGYLLEGTSYGLGRTNTWYNFNLASHASATGDNLFTSGNVWHKSSILNSLYVTTPNHTQRYTGGAQPNTSTAPVEDLHRASMLITQAYMDSTYGGYCKKWFDDAGDVGQANSTYLFSQFLWYDSSIPSVDYTATLPLAYYSPGAGYATSRSDWTTNAVQISFMCGPDQSAPSDPGDHADKAANGFVIWRNGWVVAQAKYTSNEGTTQDLSADAAYNNSALVGGHGQYQSSIGAVTKHFENGSDYTYFSGDAAAAYQKVANTTYLNGYRRDIIFLKPTYTVVCDRFDAPDSNLLKTVHINTANLTVPTTGATTYAVSGVNNLYKAYGTVLLPSSPTITANLVSLAGSLQNQPSSYRLDIAAPTGNIVDYFLQTLETVPTSQPSATAVTNLTTNGTGVQGVQIGSQVAVFEMRTGPAANFTFSMSGTGAKSCYVATDHPNTGYNWSISPTSGATTTTGAVTTSSAGFFTLAPSTTGAVTVTVTPQAAAPPFLVYQPAGSLVSSAAANSTVHLSGATFGATTGTVTFAGSGSTLSSWSTTDIAAVVPVQPSYPASTDIVASWNTSVTLSGASFASASSQYLSSNTNTSLKSSGSDMSFAFWVKLTDLSGNYDAISKWLSTGNQLEWQVYFDLSAQKWTYIVSNDGSTTTFVQATSFGTPTAGVWHFVAAILNANSQIGISVNNGTVNTTSFAHTVFGGTADFDLGARADANNKMNGCLMSVGYWKHALTAAEITTLYNGGTPLTSDKLTGTLLNNLTGFWNLNEAAGSTRLDSSGNGNSLTDHGTVGLVTRTVTGSTSATYSAFTTTAPAASGTLAIANIQAPLGTVVTTAPALSTVDVSGSLFGSSAGTVTFGVNDASITTWTSTDITCVVPAQDSYPTTVTVKVTGLNGQSDTESSFVVTTPLPTITNVQQPLATPVTSALNGSTVDIIGTFFGATSGSVTFNGVAASIKTWTDTDITVVVPTQTSYPNVGTVVVTTAGALTASQAGFVTTGTANGSPGTMQITLSGAATLSPQLQLTINTTTTW